MRQTGQLVRGVHDRRDERRDAEAGQRETDDRGADGRDHERQAHTGGGDGPAGADDAALPEPVDDAVADEPAAGHGGLQRDEGETADCSNFGCGRSRPGRDTTVAFPRTEAGRAPAIRRPPTRSASSHPHSDAFRTRWAAHDGRQHHTGTKRFRHRPVGDLTVGFDAVELRPTTASP